MTIESGRSRILKFLGTFLVGVVVGGGVVFSFGWGIMASLRGVDAQEGYKVMNDSSDAYALTKTLSYFHLGEEAKAREELEFMLDGKIISASVTSSGIDPKILGLRDKHIGAAKRYREVQPSLSSIKKEVSSVLKNIPDLPAWQEKPGKEYAAVVRLYFLRKKALAAGGNPAVHNAVLSRQEQQRIDWVRKCLNDISSFRAGMTRAQLSKILTSDGGISSPQQGRYVHPDCGYFKVTVDFRVPPGTTWSDSDVITKISEPYIETPFMD